MPSFFMITLVLRVTFLLNPRVFMVWNAYSRGLRMSCVQSTVVEPAEDILERYMVQGLSDSIVQVLLHPRRDPTKFPFELRP